MTSPGDATLGRRPGDPAARVCIPGQQSMTGAFRVGSDPASPSALCSSSATQPRQPVCLLWVMKDERTRVGSWSMLGSHKTLTFSVCVHVCDFIDFISLPLSIAQLLWPLRPNGRSVHQWEGLSVPTLATALMAVPRAQPS